MVDLLWVGLVAISLALAPATARAEEPPVATLTFIVLGPSGDEAPYLVAHFVDTRTGGDFAASFRGLSATGLPFGAYRYQLVRKDSRGGADWLGGQIDVGRRENLKVLLAGGRAATLDGRPAAIDIRAPEDFAILGVIDPLPVADDANWVHIMGLYQNYQMDLRVAHDGTFRIDEALAGVYMMTIHRAGHVLGARLLNFKQGVRSTRFVVNLGESPIMTTDVTAPAGR
jgi:hypothetical protein